MGILSPHLRSKGFWLPANDSTALERPTNVIVWFSCLPHHQVFYTIVASRLRESSSKAALGPRLMLVCCRCRGTPPHRGRLRRAPWTPPARRRLCLRGACHTWGASRQAPRRRSCAAYMKGPAWSRSRTLTCRRPGRPRLSRIRKKQRATPSSSLATTKVCHWQSPHPSRRGCRRGLCRSSWRLSCFRAHRLLRSTSAPLPCQIQVPSCVTGQAGIL